MRNGVIHSIGLAVILAASLARAGIPEPDLVLYGSVRSNQGGSTVRLVVGDLQWTIQPPGGDPVTVSATLTNINDQFSYVVRIPLESVAPGLPATSNTLQLAASPALIDFSGVTINGTHATVLAPPGPDISLAQSDRATFKQVNLFVGEAISGDADGDGLPDDWELAFFGSITGADPELDSDGDGMKNIHEFQAGTDPRSASSLFAFIEIRRMPGGGVEVRWPSAEGRTYRIQRAEDLILGPYTPLDTGLVAAPPVNAYQDTTATNDIPYFYRIELE